MSSLAPTNQSMGSPCYADTFKSGWHAGGKRRRRRQKGGQRIPICLNKFTTPHDAGKPPNYGTSLSTVYDAQHLTRTLPDGSLYQSVSVVPGGDGPCKGRWESVINTGGARKKKAASRKKKAVIKKKKATAHKKKMIVLKKKKADAHKKKMSCC